MQTHFKPEQLTDPDTAVSAGVIRRCVHCGYCNATCPTFALLGDELDGPRGRIYLMKDMLENDRTPSAEIVKHVDRCLSCLACETTCPSGVSYRRLVDHARSYIEERYRRAPLDRLYRSLLAFVLPHQGRFRAALALARLGAPLQGLISRAPALKPLAAMLALAASTRRGNPADHAAERMCRSSLGRVALLLGCAEPVLQPQTRASAVRLLARCGFEVVPAPGEACCGALSHHMGRGTDALAFARRNVDAWTRLIEGGRLDSIVVTASGCGSVIKDYGHMLRNDPLYADKALRVSAMTCDVVELIAQAGLPRTTRSSGLTVAYHAACSLQHGQAIRSEPKALLTQAGFTVREPAEAHLCCGSAGTYNILQPEIAAQLRDRKLAALAVTRPDLIASGNIGCLTQLATAAGLPVVNTVELLDWATGGPRPRALSAFQNT